MGGGEGRSEGAAAGAGESARGDSILLQAPLSRRLDWLAVLRGICSLWIVYFHLYSAYYYVPFPKTNANFFVHAASRYWELGLPWYQRHAGVLHDFFAIMSLHAVGIFILMSGFGLTRSVLRGMEGGGFSWKSWYSRRFWRLYPFFWFAHLVFLCAPFIWMPEPVDWRFALSLTGIRAYPMELMIFYANPSWWFFWLILQLYTVFPLLFLLYRRMGIGGFLLLMAAVTLVSRWLILFVWQDWRGMIIGGLFSSRLGEFAMGMALAELWRRNPDAFSLRLTGWRTFAAGLLIYPCGLLCYASLESYLFVDMLTTLGLFLLAAPVCSLVCRNGPLHRALAFAGSVSLSTFLLHQPWAQTLGEELYGRPWWLFALATAAFLPAMVWTAYGAERFVRIVLEQLRVGGTIRSRP